MSSAMSLETVTDRDFSMPSPTGSPTPLVNGERRSLGGQEEESEIEMDGLHINGNGSVERTSPLVIAHGKYSSLCRFAIMLVTHLHDSLSVSPLFYSRSQTQSQLSRPS